MLSVSLNKTFPSFQAEREKYNQALKHYELALGVLIKKLPEEPKGRRKDLLNVEVRYYRDLSVFAVKDAEK